MAEIGNLLKLVLTRDDDYLLDQRIILKREYRPHQNRHRAELHKYFVRTHALGAARRDYDCRAFRRTVVVDDAVSCAAYGAGKMLMHLDDLQDGMMNFYRKRQLKG